MNMKKKQHLADDRHLRTNTYIANHVEESGHAINWEGMT
jgi:hypothetical protein